MSIFNGITNYAVAGKGATEGYRHVREAAEKINEEYFEPEQRVEAFLQKCREAEDEFMEVNYGNDPEAKHDKGKRKGEWKYRSYLPQAYNTAKSALKNALEAGVDPSGFGKTELEKETRKVTTVKKTPDELLAAAVELVIKRFDNAGPTAQHDAINKLRNKFEFNV